MGVWIETIYKLLKILGYGVTPCMGVWIETRTPREYQQGQGVTPCMGVWIETEKFKAMMAEYKSHPVWVCGLKHPHIFRPRKS